MSTEQQHQSALSAAGIVPTAVLQIPSLVDDTLSPSVQRALANFQRREQQQQTQTPAAAAVQPPPSRVVATVKKRARVEDEGSVEERAQRLVYCGAATNDALARLLHDAAAAKDASAPHADAAAAICTALDAVLRADAATMAALRESDPAMRELQRQLQHLGQADTVLDRLLRIYSALQLSDDDVRRWKIGPTVRRLSKKAATQELRAAAQELVIRWSVAPTQRQQQHSATPTRPRRRRRAAEDDDDSDEEASAEAAAEEDDEDETVEFDDGGSEEERGPDGAHRQSALELQPPTEEEAAPKKKRAPEKHTSPKAQFLDLDFESQLAAGGAHSKRPSTGPVHATVFIDPFAEAVNEQIPSTKRTRIASISKKALSGDEIRKQRQKALENARREEEERRKAQLAPTSSSPPPTARVLSPSPPQPHENADSPPVLLSSAPAEPPATPSEPLAGSLTPGSAKRRTPKRVTWAPAQLLLKIREFERDEGDEGPHQFRSSDEARRAEAELEHKFMLEQKAAAEELWRKAKQDMQPTIAWRQPEVFRGAVKPPQLQSTEVETQKKRDESRLALMYFRPEMIPKTPKEPEEPQPAYSISDVPVFPWNEPPPAPQPVQVPSSRGAAPLPDDIAKKLSAITPSILSQLTKSLGKPLANVAPPTAPAAPVRQQPLAPPPPPLAARAPVAPPPSSQQQQQPTYAPVPAPTQIAAQQYVQPSQPQQYAPRSIPQQVYAPPPPPPPQQQRPPPTTYIQSAPQQYTYTQHQQPQVAPMAAARYGYWPSTTPTYVPQQQPQQQQYSQPPPVQYIQAQQYTTQQPQWQPQPQQPPYQQWR